MIKFLFIMTINGKVRVSKYYEHYTESSRRRLEADLIKMCLTRERTQVRGLCKIKFCFHCHRTIKMKVLVLLYCANILLMHKPEFCRHTVYVDKALVYAQLG